MFRKGMPLPAFDAGGIVGALDYDFTALAGAPNNIRGLADAKGTIREPTSLQLQQFMQASAKEMQRIQRQARKAVADSAARDAGDGTGDGAPDDDAGVTAMADVDIKAANAARKRDAENLSRLCSGDPGAETLLLLPHRIKSAFSEWLLKEMMDPEVVTGAGAPPQQMARPPAAG